MALRGEGFLDEKLAAEDHRGPAPYPLDDHQSPEKYAVYSRAILEERREGMETQFLTWTQNLLFLQGLQWWAYDRVTGQFAPPKKSPWKERPVRNILVPYAKHQLAKLTKNRPRTSCVPASTDPEDIQAGKLGDDVLRAKWQELRLSKVWRRTISWVIATGNGFLMPYWNRNSGILMPLTTIVQAAKMNRETGQPEADPATGEMLAEEVECPCDQDGNPIMTPEGGYDLEAQPAYIDIGEVGHRVLSPFQVFPDPDAESTEEMHDLVVVDVCTLREIRRNWPHVEEPLVAEDVTDIERFDQLISTLTAGPDTHLTGGSYLEEVDVPKAMVLYYFEKPCSEYPFGRSWVTVGRQLLEEPGPLPEGIWPAIVHLKDIEVPGRFHAEATMTSAVGLQREYNEATAHIKEHHNLLLRGKWLVPIGSNIRRGQITAAPGEVIQHTPGLPPKMAELRPLPAEVYNERERILGDFRLVTSVREVSMGDPPPGVSSGRAFLVLQEADDSDLGPMIEMYEEAVALDGWLMLQIIQRFYEEERLIRVSGENRRYQVRAFRGADLSAIVDVEPQTGSAFPWSKTAMQSMMIDLAREVPAVFTDQDTGQFDVERFRRLLPIGGDEAIGLDSDLDISEALTEEDSFAYWDGASPLPVPLPWQNHVLHARQHARVLKSGTFKKWPPPSQQAFIAHWMAHNAEIQAAIEAQMAMGAAAAGGGGKDGGKGGNGDDGSLSNAERNPAT